MKRLKRITLAILLFGFVAGTMTMATSCSSSKVCMAKKVGNHR